jgi:DNA polymerase III sliding clamp (beta) subunit (PCNA family)
MEKMTSEFDSTSMCRFVKVSRNEEEGKTIIEATDNKRLLRIVTGMIKIEPGLYKISKNAKEIVLTKSEETGKFPDCDRVIPTTHDLEFTVAACISREAAVYPILINKSSNDFHFKFINAAYIEDWIKVVDVGYNEVNLKMTKNGFKPILFSFSCSMFDAFYVVMPMSTDTKDIIETKSVSV